MRIARRENVTMVEMLTPRTKTETYIGQAILLFLSYSGGLNIKTKILINRRFWKTVALEFRELIQSRIRRI